MEENTGFIDYLLSSSNTWQSHKSLSSISSYSTPILQGRNKIKIEPIYESDYDEDFKKVNNHRGVCNKHTNITCKLKKTREHTLWKSIIHVKYVRSSSSLAVILKNTYVRTLTKKLSNVKLAIHPFPPTVN